MPVNSDQWFVTGRKFAGFMVNFVIKGLK